MGLQFAALLGLIATVRTFRFVPIAVMMGAVGVGIGVAALWCQRHQLRIHPEPAEGGRLITEGIYHWIRHPMYVAVLWGSCGLWLLDPGTGRLLVLLGLGLVLGLKIRLEEALLCQQFPDYAAYAKRTKRFFPWLF